MSQKNIKAIIGLGNPGQKYSTTRHNIGFTILDAFAQQQGALWKTQSAMEIATIPTPEGSLLLIKPQTFMNNSGDVVPFLLKKGIKAEEVLVIHDELELPFGKIAFKQGGSSKGHNGLKSLIAQMGEHFLRLRFGISRPVNKEDVPHYVLESFSSEEQKVLPILIQQACTMITTLL